MICFPKNTGVSLSTKDSISPEVMPNSQTTVYDKIFMLEIYSSPLSVLNAAINSRQYTPANHGYTRYSSCPLSARSLRQPPEPYDWEYACTSLMHEINR